MAHILLFVNMALIRHTTIILLYCNIQLTILHTCYHNCIFGTSLF